MIPATAIPATATFGTEVGTDRAFYSRYGWCLDPFLPLGDLLLRLREELTEQPQLTESWQQRESAVNVYLFASAIACTMDDYLDEKLLDLAPLAKIAPAGPLALADRILNLPASLRRRSKAAGWRERWTDCVDASCRALLQDGDKFAELAMPLLDTAEFSFTPDLRRRRMRIPEGFRCQDLAHQDVVTLADQYVMDARVDRAKPLLVIGPRTAGAYFAPLAAAQVRQTLNVNAAWITVRPKNGLSSGERAAIRGNLHRDGSFLVIDDHPNSGHTLRLLLVMLEGLGVAPARIAVAIPGHPVSPGWTLPEAVKRGVRIVALAPEDRYKVGQLASNWPAEVLGEPVNPDDEINQRFESGYAGGFQVRLKRLFELPDHRRVLAKSVGWGWLGYHAWVAAERMEGFVPKAIALREGFLFMEWVEGDPVLSEPGFARAMGAYVARRSRVLALDEEPRFGHPELGWCGWNDLTSALRKVYGPVLGRLKQHAIERRLRDLQPDRPTLVDGQMRPGDWIRRGGRFFKTDFEHHNFGGGELDLTDPAWDLASAIYEFGLNEAEEVDLVETYRRESGDTRIDQRLLLYKVLCALTVIRASTYWIEKKPADARRKEWVERYLTARDFATFQMARECGRALANRKTEWTERFLFLDLDGVLDWNQLGFPHTTPCGVEALRILEEGGVSVVVNTARSVEHVRQYARCYGLPGGVAELGSVFFNAVSGMEISLIDADSLAALDRARAALDGLAGVFTDTRHRHSIRAFRFEGQHTVRLSDEDIDIALEAAGVTPLIARHSSADTHIIAANAGKGAGLTAVRKLVGVGATLVAAMGDSDQDVDLLRAADRAFAPANASKGIREMAAQGACRMMRRPLQRGLLEAARTLAPGVLPSPFRSAKTSFLDQLLSAADRSIFHKALSVLRWNKL